ncbi:hypothetical protein BWI97_04390 [Siphonobacter sp. BAB-5405]|uniref:ArnT family glycosyltransferase n=1 Tax=Siphonobacter sp. BAB-5405 TaxID=1864825 RepID=UPI000C809434|nr:hypothetical protein [Siphonobacter sp. BAB-5405]PMD98404.1 hypothetical protein BWI97_04390 [Siphonobacter sp. BAB-5405]
MSIFIGVGSCLLCFFLRYQAELRTRGIYTASRLALIQTLLVHAVLVLIYSEIFSAFDQLNTLTATIYWLVIAGVWIGLSIQKNTFKDKHLYRQFIQIFRFNTFPTVYKLIFWVAILFFIAPLGLLAVYSTPNNYDSNSYHITRILVWLLNQNLDHFPTTHIQQLYHNVFAEYLILQVFLLTGTDQLINVIQFGAMLGSLSVVSLFGKRLGMDYKGQFLIGILLFTLPIGIFESTTTQSDYVACFLFLCFVYGGFQLIDAYTYKNGLFCCVALALGGFTKYPIFFFACPFAVYFGLTLLIRQGFKPTAQLFILAVVCMILTFTPFFVRNYSLFLHVLSPPEGSAFFAEKIPCDRHSVAYTISNVVKNAGLHVALPYNHYNVFMDSVIQWIHKKIGVSVNEPAISLNAYATTFSVQEDMVPNTLHFVLLLINGIFLFSQRGNREVKMLVILASIGMIIFCTLLKFQSWSTRTHMPYFAIGSIVIGFVYQKVLKLRQSVFIVFLLLSCIPFVYGNSNKMLVPTRYFSKRIVAHIPKTVNVSSLKMKQQLEPSLGPYYDFNSTLVKYSYPIKDVYPYSERMKIFSVLDDAGYFDLEKQEDVFSIDRTKAYFMSHIHDYEPFRQVLPAVGSDVKNVGFFFREGVGFYHFWASVMHRNHPDVHFNYIYYPPVFVAGKCPTSICV